MQNTNPGGGAFPQPPGFGGGFKTENQPLRAGAEPVPGYRLTRRLGAGGCGEVWEAEGPGGFHIALKFVRREDRAQESELRALEIVKGIRHPNLVVTFNAWQIEGFLVIGMELADGTLMDRLKECVNQGQTGIPREELLEHMSEAAKGIDHLNKACHDLDGQQKVGVQHRDIKPQNIMLVGGGVKIADFGLAKILHEQMASNSGSMTPAYAAPEFFRGQTSNHSDQYALAVTYCQLRGNRLPFSGSAAAMMHGHIMDPPDLTMLPDDERDAVARALEKDPTKRWPSCRAFANALRHDSFAKGKPAGTAEMPALRLPEDHASAGGHATKSRAKAEASPYASMVAHPDEPSSYEAMPTQTGHDSVPGGAQPPELRPRDKWNRDSAGGGGSQVALLVGVAVLLLAIAGGTLWGLGIFPPKKSGGEGTTSSGGTEAATFNLRAPEPLRLEVGKSATVPIEIERGPNFRGPVQLSFAGLPEGLRLDPVSIPEGRDRTSVELTAGKAPTKGEVVITATSGDVKREARLPLTISKPRGPLNVLPAGTVSLRAGGKAKFEVRVQRNALEGDVRVTFSGLPDKIVIPPVTIPAGRDSVPAEVSAQASAGVGNAQVQVRAVVEDVSAVANLTLAIDRPAALKLRLPPRLEVDVGGKTPLKVEVSREGVTGPVALRLDGLPPEVLSGGVTAPANKDEATLEVKVSDQAKEGEAPVTVVASAAGVEIREPLTLVLKDAYSALIKDGDKAYDAKDYEKAIEVYSRAVELRPERALAYRYRGVSKYRMVDPKTTPEDERLRLYDAAIADLTRAIAQDGKEIRAYVDRARVHIDKKEYEKAVGDCDAALGQDPKNASAFNQRGLALYNLKRLDDAISNYTQAIEIRKDPQYYKNRAIAYRAKRDFAMAMGDEETARQLEMMKGAPK